MGERIETAAVIVGDKVYSVPRPLRHGDAIRVAVYDDPDALIGSDGQGFVTSSGRFVSREEAAGIARSAGQIIDPKWPPGLHSEDIW